MQASACWPGLDIRLGWVQPEQTMFGASGWVVHSNKLALFVCGELVGDQVLVTARVPRWLAYIEEGEIFEGYCEHFSIKIHLYLYFAVLLLLRSIMPGPVP